MPNITLYALSTCIHCKKAKEFLDANSIPYDFTYVDKLEGDEKKQCVETVREINPGLSFPTIRVGDKVLVGFNEKELREVLEV